MSLSIRERIFANRLTALQTALLYSDAAPTLLCKIVERLNASWFAPTQFPALYVYPARENKRRSGMIYEVDIELVIHITAEIGEGVVDTQLNAIQAAVEAVMLADQSCGGIALSCHETSTIFGIEPGTSPRAVILSTWAIKFRHQATDPTANA